MKEYWSTEDQWTDGWDGTEDRLEAEWDEEWDEEWEMDSEDDAEDGFYTEEAPKNEDLCKEKTKPKKSPERISKEKRFAELYEAYMHPEKKLSEFHERCLLDDLYSLLMELNKGWVYGKAKPYQKKFVGAGVDMELALSIGGQYIYEQLKQDKADGTYVSYPVARYLRIAHHKIIDHYFRKNFGRMSQKEEEDKKETPSSRKKKTEEKIPYIESLEGMMVNSEGKYIGDRRTEFSVNPINPFEETPAWVQKEKARRIAVLYLEELMAYPDEPQKPLALMYGTILFQMAKVSKDHDELSQMARASSKGSSPIWAHRKMGRSTLAVLGDSAENTVRAWYKTSLSWGQAFRQHLLEYTDEGERWADIVYTKKYSEKDTSKWITSIAASTTQKAARRLVGNESLLEYATENLGVQNKLRKAVEEMKGGTEQ